MFVYCNTSQYLNPVILAIPWGKVYRLNLMALDSQKFPVIEKKFPRSRDQDVLIEDLAEFSVCVGIIWICWVNKSHYAFSNTKHNSVSK